MEQNVIRFENPDYLYGLILIPVLVLIYVLIRLIQKQKIRKFASPAMLAFLAPKLSTLRGNFKFVLTLLTLAAIFLALANPQTGSKMEEVKREGIDLFICVDVSNSMNAEDIAPSRIKRSKQAITRLIDQLQGDRIGLIVFAGRAYVQLPITTDYSAAKMFLSTISTDLVSSQGTNIGGAIELALKSFSDDENNKAIVVISDGEDHEEQAVKAVEEAVKKGVNVYTIGMGLADGAPIPTYNQYGKMTGYRKDNKGNTIITRLNEPMLQKIAETGNGIYVRASNSNVGLERIYKEISKIDKSEIETKVFTDYEDRFQWFVAIAIILLIVNTTISSGKREWESKFNFFDRSHENK